jgi:cytidine deaminase
LIDYLYLDSCSGSLPAPFGLAVFRGFRHRPPGLFSFHREAQTDEHAINPCIEALLNMSYMCAQSDASDGAELVRLAKVPGMTKSRKTFGENVENGLVARAGFPTFHPLSAASDDLPSPIRRIVSADARSAVEFADHLSDAPIQPQLAVLMSQARVAAERSYSPYSNFRVGAAVLAGDKLYTGCNIESASYGLTMCAERVAVFAAITDGNSSIHALAISCLDADPAGSPNQKMPCGACRQVIDEFLIDSAMIAVDNVGIFKKQDLLPIPFKLNVNKPGL